MSVDGCASRRPAGPLRFAAALFALLAGAGGPACFGIEQGGAAQVSVTVAPAAIVVERDGITGAGHGVATVGGRATVIYPNHPDDFGVTAGTGTSHSEDGGGTWVSGSDDWPIPRMVDLWQDRLGDGGWIAFGIRRLPDPKLRGSSRIEAVADDAYAVAFSGDEGRTWETETARIECPPAIGVIARPLPHIFEDGEGGLLMPAYSWGRGGTRALLLRSRDRGRHWEVAATMATAQSIVERGVPVTSPWLESSVARTSDGSLLAVIRTGSGARSALVTTRSADQGRTWSSVEKLLAGPDGRAAAGKLPALHLLPNGILVLLTAHSRNHCRLYVSPDGRGRSWGEGHVISSQSGGNAGLIGLGADEVLVIAPAARRIIAWRIRIRRGGAVVSPAVPPPANVKVEPGPGVRISWDAPRGGAGVDHYLVTPVLVAAAVSNPEMEVFPHAAIATNGPVTALDLGRVLSIGARYRFEVAAVDRGGRRSAAAMSGEVVAGSG